MRLNLVPIQPAVALIRLMKFTMKKVNTIGRTPVNFVPIGPAALPSTVTPFPLSTTSRDHPTAGVLRGCAIVWFV